MDEGIFSTYRQGENRVTASILAVLRSMTLPRIEFILGSLLNEEIELVRFQNQPSKGKGGVPDARISAQADVLIETKTSANHVRRDQLERHLKELNNRPGSWLLVLTPDSSVPRAIKEISDRRLVWASYVDLSVAIDSLLAKEKEVVSEREEFLLRELQKMFEADNLLQSNDIVVVPARRAWPEYQRFHAYICQSGRSFRHVKYLAFYSDGQVQPIIPEIQEVKDEILFQNGIHDGRISVLVEAVLNEGLKREGDVHKVFLLSNPEDPRTIHLPQPIINDLPAAFVQGQRYVSMTDLKRVTRTSELERGH